MKTKIASLVAQILNLPYRGFAVRRPPCADFALELSDAAPNAIRRYSRVQLCATFGAALLSFAASILAGSIPAGTDTSASPAILIYTTVGYPPPPPPGATNIPGPHLVVALWRDGKIIWSEQRVAGGPPYFQGQFDRKKLEALLGSLNGQGFWTNAALQRPWFGPDSKTTRIVINDGHYQLVVMESWHELYEQHSNTVATAQGLTSLNGRDRAEVLREQPPDYRRFRNTWSEIRDQVAEMIPATGEPYTNNLPAMKW